MRLTREAFPVAYKYSVQSRINLLLSDFVTETDIEIKYH